MILSSSPLGLQSKPEMDSRCFFPVFKKWLILSEVFQNIILKQLFIMCGFHSVRGKFKTVAEPSKVEWITAKHPAHRKGKHLVLHLSTWTNTSAHCYNKILLGQIQNLVKGQKPFQEPNGALLELSESLLGGE